MKTRRCAIWGSAVFGMLYSFYAAAQLYTFADIEPKDGRLRGSTALVMLWNVRKDEVRIAKQAIPWVQVFKDSAGERYYTESEGDAVLSVKKSAGKITDVVEMTETNTAYYATHTKLDRDGKFLSRTFCVLESCLTYLERDCREIEKFNQKTVDSCIAEIKKMENYLRDLDDDAHNNAHAESAAAFKAVSKDAKKRGYKYVLPPGIRLSYPLHYRNRGDVWRTTVPKEKISQPEKTFDHLASMSSQIRMIKENCRVIREDGYLSESQPSRNNTKNAGSQPSSAKVVE